MGDFTKKLSEISNDMTEQCGGKAAHLGELTRIGFNVPPGFCVTSQALFDHIEENGIREAIFAIAKAFNYEDFDNIQKKSTEIRSLIEKAKVPSHTEAEILREYHELAIGSDVVPYVAVRSSVAVKDTSISSFPGMMDTYYYVRGDNEVIDYIRRCWASVWTDRAVFARHQKRLDHEKALIAPIVQVMVNSDIAGVIFTANPINLSTDEMVIEANWGLGESVVSGRAQTDYYLVDKKTLKVKQKRIVTKNLMVVRGTTEKQEWREIDLAKSDIPTLTDDQVREVGERALAAEKHYDRPQDVEWAYEAGRLYILQCRKCR